jgi:hypothetical protein
LSGLEFNKIENFLNRALVITVHLNNQVEKSRKNSTNIESLDYIYNDLRLAYVQFKSITAALKNFISINEDTKQLVREFELRIIREHENNKFQLNLESQQAHYTEKFEIKTGKEKEKLRYLAYLLENHFLKKRYLGKYNDISQIHSNALEAIADIKLKKEFFQYLAKLTGVIEGLYRLFRQNDMDESVNKIIQETYEILSKDAPHKIYTKDAIKELEDSYNLL